MKAASRGTTCLARVLALTLPAAALADGAPPAGTRPAAPAARAAAAPGKTPGEAAGPETQAVRRADGQDLETERVSGGSGGSLGGWLRTLAALAVVVALILVLRWVLRRLSPGARARPMPEAVEVLARTNVSARQQLLLVRLGRRLVLVGSGPEGMSTLAEVTDPGEVDALLARARGGREAKAAEDPSSGEGRA